MILSLYVCLPLEKAQIAGWISRRTGVWLQHIYQTAFFFFWTLLIWRSDWTFFSAGSFVMHMFTMLMKMHSYLSTNRVLSGKLKELAKLKQERSKLGVDEKEIQESINQHILELQDDLFPPGATPYPQSVNFRNFTDFLRVPALVYQLDYPRTEKIRWGYVVEKLAGFAGTVVLAYIVISTFILPNLQAANDISVVELIGQLWFPMLFVYLLIFLMIWEYLVNVFAELSRFADRNFYDAWWNSTSFEHFARTWNKVGCPQELPNFGTL